MLLTFRGVLLLMGAAFVLCGVVALRGVLIHCPPGIPAG